MFALALKTHFREMFAPFQFIDTRAVTPMLLIIVKLTAIFSQVQLNMWVSTDFTETKVNNFKPSAVSDEILECDCSLDFNNFSILAANACIFNLVTKENHLIKREELVLTEQFSHSL